MKPRASEASLENLIELEEFGLDVLHPGGLDTTWKLASRCGISSGDRVLDVASGTGEAARFLVERSGAHVVGVDRSASMIARARRRTRGLERSAVFVRGDAHALPFRSASFDHVICECTLSLLDKEVALAEMARVARPGGFVAFHEICWKEGAPAGLRARLAELEHERPETIEGWRALLAAQRVRDIHVDDLSELIPRWMADSRKKLGVTGYLRAVWQAFRRWGPGGLLRILSAERLFQSPYLGYGLFAGRKEQASHAPER